MTFGSVVTEISVVVMFLLAVRNSWGEGRRWFWTLIFGAVAGFIAEILIVHAAEPRYTYGAHLFVLKAWDVPVCVGLGWGIVFYISGWAAQRMCLKGRFATPFVAGLLGVNLDLSLDPVANLQGFWSWKLIPGSKSALDGTLFGVPFDNFVSWVVLIGLYSGCVRELYRRLNKKHAAGQDPLPGNAARSQQGNRWIEAIIPPIAFIPAAGAFVLLRLIAPKVYAWAGWGHGAHVGEEFCFGLIFVLGSAMFWWTMFKASRNEEGNLFVLFAVFYFHTLSFALFFLGGGPVTEYAPMIVLIPVNLMVGLLAFAWPHLDWLFEVTPAPGEKQFGVSLTYRTLSSYGGERVRALYCAPSDEPQLRAVLDYAKNANKRITFRAGGQAFDTQSLNDHIVISLNRFDKIGAVDVNTKMITVGAGAKWGAILKETLRHNLVPHIMVTTSRATAGGTMSAHSVSRFSPTCGREGKHIESFRLLTCAGQTLDCSRQNERQLFLAVIGGLGYVGAVLEVTYRLRSVPAPVAVETTFELITGIGRIGKAVKGASRNPTRFAPLIAKAEKQLQECRGAARDCRALSAAVNMRGGAWGLIADSKYVQSSGDFTPSIFHSPHSIAHRILQFCAWIPLLRKLGYALTFSFYRNGPKTYFDEVAGYTFFEDGHAQVRRLLQLIGFPCRVVQQTYLLPAPVQQPGSALANFMQEMEDLFTKSDLNPALIDVLYVPRDDEPFELSSSNWETDAFIVTLTFENLIQQLTKANEALSELTRICANLQGRVHLVKNVRADTLTVQGMYNPAGLAALRRFHGAAAFVHNGFADRVLPHID